MSAIWGCVDFSGKALPEGLCEAMRKPLDKYRIDRFEQVVSGNVVMGCGIQYVTREAVKEALPIFDGEVYFTADGMIDNRDELIAGLSPGESDIPDGTLMYLAYKKWREAAAARLRGSFSYVAYDVKSNLVHISADHTSSRCLYYCLEGSILYFSTAIIPITEARAAGKALNEQWISDFLTLTIPLVVLDTQGTPFENIFKISPAERLAVTATGIDRTEFWNPTTWPRRKYTGDDGFKEEFRSIMTKAADELASRGTGMGVYLSSGFDSATIAAFAATALKEEGRTLHSYTSVPLSEYSEKRDRWSIYDETTGVEALCRMYDNIQPNIMPLEGMDAFTNAKQYLLYNETPFKGANSMWLHAFSEQAAKDGCRIMLNGQMGNNTFSWGEITVAAKTWFMAGRPFQAMRTISDYGLWAGIRRKPLFKRFLTEFLKSGKAPAIKGDFLDHSIVNRVFSSRHKSAERILMNPLYVEARIIRYLRDTEPWEHNRFLLSVSGEGETKLGLAHGFAVRDVSRDVRVYEFCRSAPLECFVRDGQTRRLVRDYLSDLLPDEIIGERRRKGVQSDDWVQRMGRRWPDILGELREAYQSASLAPYIDAETVTSALEKLDDSIGSPDDESESIILNLLTGYIMARFLDSPPDKKILQVG